MKKSHCLVLLLITIAFTASTPAEDQLTPLVVSPLVDTTRQVTGTDGKVHLVYELVLTNTNITPATPKKIEVLLDGQSTPLATFQDEDLRVRLRNTGNGEVKNPVIEYNGTRIFFVDFALDWWKTPPTRLWHRIETLAAPSPSPKEQTPVLLTYTVAPIDIFQKVPIVIGPPLHGKGWLALNGCCAPGSGHRSTGLPVNGKIYFAQRFAIDWMQMDDQGRLINGDPSDVRGYTSYGADVIAVADGKVVEILNDLNDQKPGVMPDPSTINVHNVDGNHIVIDLGGGVFAFYAHLQKGSVAVKPGDHVHRGQKLAKLGNTGNTSGPHLHFHLMNGPSVLGSNGIPYVIDSFAFDGTVSEKQFQDAKDLTGNWGTGRLPSPSPRKLQFPLDLNIVDFP
ncbi:MAG TPA: M23 family metallopeptidase [Terriglobales bacterium]